MSLTGGPASGRSSLLMNNGRFTSLYPRQCRVRAGPCQGKPRTWKPPNLQLFLKGLLADSALCRRPARRRAFDGQFPVAKADERARERTPRRRRCAHAVINEFELAQFDRPLVADMRDRTAKKAQPHFVWKIAERARGEDDRSAPAPRLGRERRARGANRKFNRRFRAPHARTQPRQSFRVETLRREPRQQAAQPRARKTRIAVARIIVVVNAGGPERRDQPCFWDAKQGTKEKDLPIRACGER